MGTRLRDDCRHLAHWGGWRQGCASRRTGGARRRSMRPLSIGSSHCLNQYGCIGCLVMGGNGLSRPGGNSGFRV